jgi:hypothetical protein
MSAESEKLKTIRDYIASHPEEARKILEELQSSNIVDFSNQNSSNSMGGQRKTLSTAIGRAYADDKNNRGFSNYLLLAIFAFTIQFIITLICIFFYK